MKILLITPYLPHSRVTHAGGKFIYDLIARLKERGFQVSLISFFEPGESRYLDSVKPLCEASVFLARAMVFPKTLVEYFLERPFLCAIKLFLFFFESMVQKIRLTRSMDKMTRETDFDVLQVEYSIMGLIMKKIKFNGLKVLDLQDLKVKPAVRELSSEKNAVLRSLRGLKVRAVEKMEISFCGKFDCLMVKSEFDRKILNGFGDFDIKVAPLGVVVPETRIQAGEREENSVLFVGAMFRDFNENAVLYFVNEVMPRLNKGSKDVKFYIVGDRPSDRVLGLSSGSVTVTGYVEDLARFYNRCRVFVAPLFIGGGQIFKVLEAMSFGVPVVATSVANEGILAEDGREILIADTPGEFCEKITGLLENGPLWDEISRQARVFVEKTYSWDRVIDRYMEVYKKPQEGTG
ncbi:MAG: glycosyltransferase [Candidatus Omnitrophica bacterium]|nr:glycosyltransferase [Candidatus Omnitrophota bacterium]